MVVVVVVAVAVVAVIEAGEVAGIVETRTCYSCACTTTIATVTATATITNTTTTIQGGGGPYHGGGGGGGYGTWDWEHIYTHLGPNNVNVFLANGHTLRTSLLHWKAIMKLHDRFSFDQPISSTARSRRKD